jgi:hypothetical protein
VRGGRGLYAGIALRRRRVGRDLPGLHVRRERNADVRPVRQAGCRWHGRHRRNDRRHVHAGRGVRGGLPLWCLVPDGNVHGLHVRRGRDAGLRALWRRQAGCRRHGWHGRDDRRHVRAWRRVHGGLPLRCLVTDGDVHGLHVRCDGMLACGPCGGDKPDAGGTAARWNDRRHDVRAGRRVHAGFRCGAPAPQGMCTECMCGADGMLACGPCGGGTGGTGAGGTGGTATGPCQVMPMPPTQPGSPCGVREVCPDGVDTVSAATARRARACVS